MKTPQKYARWIPICLILAGTLAWLGLRSTDSPPARVEIKQPAAIHKDTPPGLVVLNDPVRIFQKAFWRSPNANDQILHAERREWPGEDGVGKWQWFIVLQPSPELVKYLREDNAFGLASAKSAPGIDDAPVWFDFKSSEADVLLSPTTNLRFIFTKSGTLHATDSGSALRPGAPEKPAPATKSVASTGRLPTTPPPTPLPH